EAPAGRQAQIDVAGTKLRRSGGEPDVTGPGDGGAAANTPAAHRRDDRFRVLLDQVDHVHADLPHGRCGCRIGLATALEVGAGAEGASSGAADHDGSSLVAVLQRLEDRDDVLE